MRLVLRCFAASTALTFLIAALIFVSRSNLLSNMAGALILPAAWLSDKVFGEFVSTSANGLNNLLALTPFILLCNILIYATVFYVAFRTMNVFRRKNRS